MPCFVPITQPPIEVYEEVINQASSNTSSLRHLSLVCKAFQARTRYYLFSTVLLQTAEQLNKYHDFLDSHPWARPLVQKVTLSISVPAAKGRSSTIPHLVEIVPVTLLTQLPNLRTWMMGTFGDLTQASLSLHHSVLGRYQRYGDGIRNLELSGILFEDVSDFVGFVLAFKSIYSLTCSHVSCRTAKAHKRSLYTSPLGTDEVARPLNVKSLNVTTSVDILAIEYMLAASASALETLVIALIHDAQPQCHDYFMRLEQSMCRLSQLSSLSLRISCVDVVTPDGNDGDGHWGISQDIRRVTKILVEYGKRACVRDVRIEFKLDPIASLGLSLFCGDITSEQCKALEESLLAVPVSRILFHDPVNTRREGRAEFWSPTIKRAFPRLNHQGLLEFQRTKPETPDPLGHEASINCLVASCDGKWIATGSSDGTIIVWDTWSSTIVQAWLAHRGPVLSLGLSPDGRRLVSAGGKGTETLVVWDFSEGLRRAAALDEVHADVVTTCSWSPDGELIASASPDGTVCLWHAQTLQALDLLYGPRGLMSQPRRLQFSPDACNLAWISDSSNGATCSLWRPFIAEAGPGILSHGRLGAGAMNHGNKVIAFAFHPKSGCIATAHEGYHEQRGGFRVRIWNVATHAELAVLSVHNQRVEDITFSPDGRHVIAASFDGFAKIWDVELGQETASLGAGQVEMSKVCVSPDGRLIATVSPDGVRLWHWGNGKGVPSRSCVAMFTEHRRTVTHMVFSSDSRYLISGDEEGILRIRLISSFIHDPVQVRST